MTEKTGGRLSPRTKGVIFLLISAFSFAVMALFINLAGDMPVFMKAFFRNLVAIAMSYIMLARSPEKFKIKKGSLPGLLMRASFGTIGIIANFYAISNANMSDAMMLNKLSPFFALVTSIFILKEAADGFHECLDILGEIGDLGLGLRQLLQRPLQLFHLLLELVGVQALQ